MNAADKMAEALRQIMAAIPCSDGMGNFVVDHHDYDGRFLGTEHFDPYKVACDVGQIAAEALAYYEAEKAQAVVKDSLTTQDRKDAERYRWAIYGENWEWIKDHLWNPDFTGLLDSAMIAQSGEKR